MKPTTSMNPFGVARQNSTSANGERGLRTFRFNSLFGVLSLILILSGSGFAQAQGPALDPQSKPNATFQKTGDKIGPGVREALESDGSVRVIVALQTPASLKRPNRSKFNEIRRDVENAQNGVINALDSGDHSMRRRYRMVPAFATDIHTSKALDRLARHPFVVKVDLDERATGDLVHSVPLIQADSMHAHGYTGSGIVVGVLDSGIDTDHPDLANDLIHEECFAGGGRCPDGTDRQSGPGAAEDDYGHGTHVSGIITSSGIVSSIGVAPDAKIVAIKVLGADNSAWFSDILAGLDWILDNRPDVSLINMSLGGGLYTGECDQASSATAAFSVAVNTLRAVGVTTFASSGNDNSATQMASPACVSAVISVSATDDDDRVASFANTNAYTDLLAPGVRIVSDTRGGGSGTKSGTSMASPHAVACAALQLESGRATTPGSIEAWLKGSGVPVTDTRNDLNFPRINCFREPSFASSDDLFGSVGPPDGAGGCGGTGSYTLNVIGGTISRTGDTTFNHWAVGYRCWGFDEQYVRVYIVADDPATFDHWESPSGHAYLLDGHNGTSATTIETSFNLNGQSPTFQAVYSGGDPTPELTRVNRLSGAGSIVGSFSSGSSPVYPAMAVHPTTQVMYVGGGDGAAVLHTVDPATGMLTPIGTGGSGITRIAAMDFHYDGTLYASVKVGSGGGPGANYLATIDPATGAGTLVGSFGTCGERCSIEGMGAIAFDAGGILYGALHERAQNGTPGLYRINRFTGTATFVAPIIDGSSMPPSGGITSLQFVDGVLYGGTAVSKTPPGDGGWLVTIDEMTGEFSKIGASSATGGRGLIGLAPRFIRPANDDLADAIATGSLPYYGFGNNAHATTESSEAFGSCSSDHGKSVWWSFSPGVSGRFEINTSGSGINTGLSIWTGTGHPLDEVECDDNSGEGTASLIRFDATAGEAFLLRIIGYAGMEGDIVLNISQVDFDCATQTDISVEECLALADFYESTDGEHWDQSTDWKYTNGPCTWYGVSCSGGHVTSLILNDNNVSGPLPESLGDLSNLTYLDLSYNDLVSLPSSIGNLTDLTWLDVTHSGLTDPLPSSIGNLTNLAYLDFSWNSVEGPLPSSIGNLTNLTHLDGNHNPLASSLPESIGNLVNLTNLDLHSCGLTGSIPESIGNLTNLTELALRVNGLTDPLPESIGNLASLEDLSLSENNLTGSLPESIGNLASLKYLSISNNSLTGPIPESIGNLDSLEYISIGTNNLTGAIPESIGNLSNLVAIQLEANSLTGAIPESIGNLSKLGSLYLAGNNLTGTIPKSIGNMTSLGELHLYGNSLTGPIPESIGNLSNLAYLFASDNELTGPLPPSMGYLNNLRWLTLDENNLQGTVPLPVATIGAMAWNGCTLSDNPELCIPDIPEYQAWAYGGQICGLPLDPDCDPIVHAEARVFLEGPYSTSGMHADTMFTDHCPNAQPYSDPVFDGTPLDYDAPNVPTSPPDSVVDWVLVSLRNDVAPETLIPGSVRAGFVLAKGWVVDTAGGPIAFPGVPPGGYRIVVRHRNHADVMSSSSVDFSNGIGSWDFTTSMTQAYTAADAPMKALGDGQFGMFACDANVDGQITAPDFNLWNAATTAGQTGYRQADCNLDGQVTAPDFNLWNANTTAGAASQMPD